MPLSNLALTAAHWINHLRRTIQTLFGAVVSPLLEEYAAVIGEETELECRHFFEQGYLNYGSNITYTLLK